MTSQLVLAMRQIRFMCRKLLGKRIRSYWKIILMVRKHPVLLKCNCINLQFAFIKINENNRIDWPIWSAEISYSWGRQHWNYNNFFQISQDGDLIIKHVSLDLFITRSARAVFEGGVAKQFWSSNNPRWRIQNSAGNWSFHSLIRRELNGNKPKFTAIVALVRWETSLSGHLQKRVGSSYHRLCWISLRK